MSLDRRRPAGFVELGRFPLQREIPLQRTGSGGRWSFARPPYVIRYGLACGLCTPVFQDRAGERELYRIENCTLTRTIPAIDDGESVCEVNAYWFPVTPETAEVYIRQLHGSSSSNRKLTLPTHPKKSVDRARGTCRAEAYLASHVDRLRRGALWIGSKGSMPVEAHLHPDASPRDLPCTGKVFLDCSQCHQFREEGGWAAEKKRRRTPTVGLSAAKASSWAATTSLNRDRFE